ncbi:alpha/beta hydrolase [Rhodococcus sp. USK10]|uniref:alpha/beta fold hydrolase n=1 Tax=Rhodococcus sp. USK10 TaxID=2789739 RepID=UPI001C5F8490|nr:alpha/beta fold hydrolase [Rhodococcus sp. USK10]QYB02686.1 alpha/beta hydrolase [Rhodococcus sp. USK10]
MRERVERAGDVVLHTVGDGPALVVVHGGGVTIDSYRRLARKLSDRFTVHLYNRRGRGDAPPRSEPYDVQQDVDDLRTVLENTGATDVIGHSSGGFIALTAALQLPIARLALYDAAVSVNGLFPAQWLEGARAAARDGDVARAMAITGAGINTQSRASTLPLGVQIAMSRLLMRTPVGRTMGALLPMTLDESQAIARADGPASRWAGVTAEVLLVRGADGPPYYEQLSDALAAALPHGRVAAVRGGHDGINRASAQLIRTFADFFGPTAHGQR